MPLFLHCTSFWLAMKVHWYLIYLTYELQQSTVKRARCIKFHQPVIGDMPHEFIHGGGLTTLPLLVGLLKTFFFFNKYIYFNKKSTTYTITYIIYTNLLTSMVNKELDYLQTS